MPNKPKIFLGWIAVFLLGSFLGAIVLMQTSVTHQAPTKAPLSPGGSNTGAVSQDTEPSGGVEQKIGSIPTGNSSPGRVSPESSRLQLAPASKESAGSVNSAGVPEASSVSARSSEDQTGQQEAQTATLVPVNAPPSDAEILEQIKQQDQSKQSLQQLSAARNKEAARVMRSITAVKGQPENSQEVISSDAVRPAPPADVVQKIKSHQLTAH